MRYVKQPEEVGVAFMLDSRFPQTSGEVTPIGGHDRSLQTIVIGGKL
jgi:hypothetical protein